jgi:D-glycero-D-manno-heptose 1,7-bisphosphate phosphatase
VGSGARSAIFLDKDGTLLDDVPFNVDPSRMQLAPGAADALRKLGALPDLPLIVVSNQAGIAQGRFSEAAMGPVKQALRQMFATHGARLTAFYYCPHHPDGNDRRYARMCHCRKPQAGMLEKAAAEHGIDLRYSWMIGDILDDIEAGRRAGCTTILIHNGNETEWQLTALREPHYSVARLDQAARLICDWHRTGAAAQARVS